MSVTTRFAAAIATLSVLLSPVVTATPFAYSSGSSTTGTVYAASPAGPTLGLSTPEKAGKNKTSPISLVSIPASFPTYSPGNPNPNGPFYNPNDYVPVPFTWPGKPTGRESLPPPRPTPHWNYGGKQGHLYNAPAWVPKGSNLKPALSQSETNGDSVWGTLQCPRLPPRLGPGNGNGTVKASLSSSSKSPFKTSSLSFGSSSKNLIKTSSLSFGPSSKATLRTSTLSFGLSGRPTASPSSSFPGSPSAGSSSSRSSNATVSSSLSSSSGSFNATGTSSSFSFLPTGFSSSFSGTGPSVPFPTFSSATGPFGNGTINNTLSACGPIPDTGVTRKFNFDVSLKQIAPDGVQKNGLVVNGGFPGPLIEANWGDWIEVTVKNNLPDEGTALHWHGLLQTETPWFDGVPSVNECPIAPGEVLVYKFRADMYGTTWYHSHYSGQYAGGALGPIVIHGPKTADYDEDLGPIVLSDWYHKDYFTLVNETMSGALPLSDNNLINGKMNYPCENTTFVCTPNAGISKFSFKAGKKYRLRLINTSAEGIQKFTLDGHNFTVIANDFIPINPYSTDVITLGVGQRSDVIVEAVGKAGDAYWMRSNLGTLQKGCSATSTVSPEALAAVYYENADTNSVPTTNSTLTDAQLTNCGNDPLSLTTAFCALTPAAVPATSETVDITFGSNGTNFVWFMNNVSFRGDYNNPVLSAVKNGNLTFEREWNVYNFGTNSTIQIVIKNHFPFASHPMHLHGHNFHVLHEGFGDWDGTVTNPANTQMRDVQLVRPAQDATTPAYIVLQWTNDNPAVWPLHCHIAWHVSAGLYINVLENPAGIQARDFPASVADTCASWDAWTSRNIPDQIDSGL